MGITSIQAFRERFKTYIDCYNYLIEQKWGGSFRQVWIHLLQSNKVLLDLSTAQLDGSHTTAKRDGESVGYQGNLLRK